MPDCKRAMKAYCIVSFIVLSITPIYSQSNTKVDSLIQLLDTKLDDTTRYNVYYDLFRNHYRRDLPAAKVYLDQEIALANKIGKADRLARSQNHLGIFLSVSGKYEEALEVFVKLREQYQQVGDKRSESKSLTNIANANRRLGNVKKALEFQMEALRIDEERGVKGNEMGNNYFSLGNMHGEVNNIEASTAWYVKATNIYKEVGNQEYLMRANHMIGLNYMIQDSLDLAKSYLKESKEYYEATENPYALSMALDNLGTVAEKEGKIERAIDLFEMSLNLATSTQQLSMEGALNQRLAELYTSQGKYKNGVKYGTRALDISTQLSERRKEVLELKILADAYKGLGEIHKAYDYQNKFLTLSDSILKEDNRVLLEEIEVKYQTEKKEQEIVLLEEKSKIDQLKKKGLFGGIVALTALFGLVFYSLKQRMKRNEIAKEKLDLELEYSKRELDIRKQELTTFALQLANKNETLENIKRNVQDVRTNDDDRKSIQSIVNSIDFNINDDNNWETFRQRFEAVHKDFEKNVKSKYESLTPNELRLMALLKMNLSSKEIANILNVSVEGIKKARYRLRKKLSLETADSLEEVVMAL